MMSAKKELSEAALRAMKRAANSARERAAEKNIEIPVWKEGKIVFEVPVKHPDPSQNAKP